MAVRRRTYECRKCQTPYHQHAHPPRCCGQPCVEAPDLPPRETVAGTAQRWKMVHQVWD